MTNEATFKFTTKYAIYVETPENPITPDLDRLVTCGNYGVTIAPRYFRSGGKKFSGNYNYGM